MSRDRVFSEDHILGGMFGYQRKIFGLTGITKTSRVRNGQGRAGEKKSQCLHIDARHSMNMEWLENHR